MVGAGLLALAGGCGPEQTMSGALPACSSEHLQVQVEDVIRSRVAGFVDELGHVGLRGVREVSYDPSVPLRVCEGTVVLPYGRRPVRFAYRLSPHPGKLDLMSLDGDLGRR